MRWQFWRNAEGDTSTTPPPNEPTAAPHVATPDEISAIFKPRRASARREAARSENKSEEEDLRGALRQVATVQLSPNNKTSSSSQQLRPFSRPAKAADEVRPQQPSVASSLSKSVPPAVHWRDLPPCPVAGMELRESGLVKLSTSEPVPLNELVAMIKGTAGIESKAKHAVDLSLSSQLGKRGGLAVNVVLFPVFVIAALYALYRAPQHFELAVPRKSFVMRMLVDPKAPELVQEQIAMRYRKLLRVANKKVLATSLAGVGIFAMYALVRPSVHDLDHNAQSDVNRETVAYQHHTEGALKYLWCVYFHHPAYSNKTVK